MMFYGLQTLGSCLLVPQLCPKFRELEAYEACTKKLLSPALSLYSFVDVVLHST